MPDRKTLPLRPSALLFVFFATVYFLTRSPGLDEWDSVQFALGVRHFAQAKAIYTDDPNIALRPGWKLERLALYHRSILIAPKHRKIGVYRIEPTANP